MNEDFVEATVLRPKAVSTGPVRCPLFLHPGEQVKVRRENGRLILWHERRTARIDITDIPGLVENQ